MGESLETGPQADVGAGSDADAEMSAVNRLRHLIVIETDVGELVLGAAPGLNKDVPRLLFAAGLHKLIQYRAERTPSVRSSHGASNLNQFLFVASQVDLLPGYGFVLFLLRARYV